MGGGKSCNLISSQSAVTCDLFSEQQIQGGFLLSTIPLSETELVHVKQSSAKTKTKAGSTSLALSPGEIREGKTLRLVEP